VPAGGVTVKLPGFTVPLVPAQPGGARTAAAVQPNAAAPAALPEAALGAPARTAVPAVPTGIEAEVPLAEPAGPEPAVVAEAAAAAAPAEPVLLDVDGHLTVEDVRRVLGRKGLVRQGSLPGIAAGETYNNIYFASQKAGQFGLAFQVWQERNIRDARDRWTRMLRSYPSAKATQSVTKDTMYAQWSDIVYIGFMDLKRKSVAVISCSKSICTPDAMLELANTVKARM
jgi:hypothetical protein